MPAIRALPVGPPLLSGKADELVFCYDFTDPPAAEASRKRELGVKSPPAPHTLGAERQFSDYASYRYFPTKVLDSFDGWTWTKLAATDPRVPVSTSINFDGLTPVAIVNVHAFIYLNSAQPAVALPFVPQSRLITPPTPTAASLTTDPWNVIVMGRNSGTDYTGWLPYSLEAFLPRGTTATPYELETSTRVPTEWKSMLLRAFPDLTTQSRKDKALADWLLQRVLDRTCSSKWRTQRTQVARRGVKLDIPLERSTILVLLSRLAGLPAHLQVGYHDVNDDGRVTADEARIWSRVWLNGRWTIQDPVCKADAAREAALKKAAAEKKAADKKAAEERAAADKLAAEAEAEAKAAAEKKAAEEKNKRDGAEKAPVKKAAKEPNPSDGHNKPPRHQRPTVNGQPSPDAPPVIIYHRERLAAARSYYFAFETSDRIDDGSSWKPMRAAFADCAPLADSDRNQRPIMTVWVRATKGAHEEVALHDSRPAKGYVQPAYQVAVPASGRLGGRRGVPSHATRDLPLVVHGAPPPGCLPPDIRSKLPPDITRNLDGQCNWVAHSLLPHPEAAPDPAQVALMTKLYPAAETLGEDLRMTSPEVFSRVSDLARKWKDPSQNEGDIADSLGTLVEKWIPYSTCPLVVKAYAANDALCDARRPECLPLLNFVLGQAKGNRLFADCDVHNTIFNILARYIGIPAQFVHGYRGDHETTGGILEGHRHAWTRVWLPRARRWHRVDATSWNDLVMRQECPEEERKYQVDVGHGLRKRAQHLYCSAALGESSLRGAIGRTVSSDALAEARRYYCEATPSTPPDGLLAALLMQLRTTGDPKERAALYAEALEVHWTSRRLGGWASRAHDSGDPDEPSIPSILLMLYKDALAGPSPRVPVSAETSPPPGGRQSAGIVLRTLLTDLAATAPSGVERALLEAFKALQSGPSGQLKAAYALWGQVAEVLNETQLNDLATFVLALDREQLAKLVNTLLPSATPERLEHLLIRRSALLHTVLPAVREPGAAGGPLRKQVMTYALGGISLGLRRSDVQAEALHELIGAALTGAEGTERDATLASYWREILTAYTDDTLSSHRDTHDRFLASFVRELWRHDGTTFNAKAARDALRAFDAPSAPEIGIRRRGYGEWVDHLMLGSWDKDEFQRIQRRSNITNTRSSCDAARYALLSSPPLPIPTVESALRSCSDSDGLRTMLAFTAARLRHARPPGGDLQSVKSLANLLRKVDTLLPTATAFEGNPAITCPPRLRTQCEAISRSEAMAAGCA